MKICSKCGEARPKIAGGWHGKVCRDCVKLWRAAYRTAHLDAARGRAAAYYATHRAEVRARVATYRAAHPDKRRDQSAAYRAAHQVEIRAYYATHREELCKQARVYQKAHPEAIRANHAARRVRLLGGFVEKVDIAVLVERDGGRCGICHKKVKAAERSIDHVLPVSKGGAHSYANTRLAHLRCNVVRGNRGAAQLGMEFAAQFPEEGSK